MQSRLLRKGVRQMRIQWSTIGDRLKTLSLVDTAFRRATDGCVATLVAHETFEVTEWIDVVLFNVVVQGHGCENVVVRIVKREPVAIVAETSSF